MGGSVSRTLHIFNGTRYLVFVALCDEALFEYKMDGSRDSKLASVVRVGNGSCIQIYPPEKYLEVTIECKDEQNRRAKFLSFYTQYDVAWVVRNYGVMRSKQGTFWKTQVEDYSRSSSTYFEDLRDDWKKVHGTKVRFYEWDVDNETILTKRDREDRVDLEEMREECRLYGITKNWMVLANADIPKILSRPDKKQLIICKEFISAFKMSSSTIDKKISIWDVKSLKDKKQLNGWQLVVQGLENVTESLVFERLILKNSTRFFAIVCIQQGPIFTIRTIQSALTDSMVHQTSVWLTEPKLNLHRKDLHGRNFQAYNATDCCIYWVPWEPKYSACSLALMGKQPQSTCYFGSESIIWFPKGVR